MPKTTKNILNITNFNSEVDALNLSLTNATNQIIFGYNNLTTTIDSPAPSSAITLTLPNTTDTIVGRATTDTLTNKSLNTTNCSFVDPSDNTKKIFMNCE